ncbi:MAG: hypothetical protein ISN28_11080 [Ectothiorhodospiraceae bacterium AqS1]|nr:hypothetical protein [Ectothiorhodospiraceae bacterium AqS1]
MNTALQKVDTRFKESSADCRCRTSVGLAIDRVGALLPSIQVPLKALALRALAIFSMLILSQIAAAQIHLGNINTNPYDPDSVDNPYGAGSPYRANSIRNTYGPYGSRYSNRSVNNRYATKAPKLYDKNGNYRGRLSSNPYDPDSISNPNSRFHNSLSDLNGGELKIISDD